MALFFKASTSVLRSTYELINAQMWSVILVTAFVSITPPVIAFCNTSSILFTFPVVVELMFMIVFLQRL